MISKFCKMYNCRLFLVLLTGTIAGCKSDNEPKNDFIKAFAQPKTVLQGDDIRNYILHEAAKGKSYKYEATVTSNFEGQACFTLAYPKDSPFTMEAAHADSAGLDVFLVNKCIYKNIYVKKNEKITLDYTLTFDRPTTEEPNIVSFQIKLISDMTESPEITRGFYQGILVERAIVGGLYLILTPDYANFPISEHYYVAPINKNY